LSYQASQTQGTINTIIKASAHLKLHQDKRCRQEVGIFSSSLNLFIIQIGI
jgi:hypothetical protein